MQGRHPPAYPAAPAAAPAAAPTLVAGSARRSRPPGAAVPPPPGAPGRPPAPTPRAPAAPADPGHTVLDVRVAAAYAPTVAHLDLSEAPGTAPPRGEGAPPPARRRARRGARRRGGRRAGRGARRRAPAPGTGALRRLLPRALVLAFLAGGTTAFLAADKEVRLSADGDSRTLHTFAGDVEALLHEEGLLLGPHDTVSPPRAAGLDSGDRVEVRRGRPLVLTLDGRRRTVWTTAATVDEALRALGVPADGPRPAAARTPIPPTGLALDVRTGRTAPLPAGHPEARPSAPGAAGGGSAAAPRP
ncbi:ubiquitin-like domain-containing protein [Streptomyces sp. C10-9-1]|uniref:ubiquitin-like domain-containing protein n=1 Tax=Streptomyces sp. C10-9-1 TaxID=1859285 RepID=UPI0027E43655|nr:ubiquitin-like domain-containing protein [Streptomyces sp. C10-9-1]